MLNFETINDSDLEKAQGSEYQATWQTRELPTFSFRLSFLPHRIGFLITQAPILKPLKSHLPGLIATRKRLAVSLRSSIEVCKDRIMQVKVASLKKKSELGELEGLVKLNFCDHAEWAGLEVHYKQPNSVGSLSHTKLVKQSPFLFVFIQKRNLEDHLFTKNPAIEPESCNKLCKIVIRVDRSLAFHHIPEEQDMHKDIKLNNILNDLEVSKMLLYRSLLCVKRTTKCTTGGNNYPTNVDSFTSLNIPSVSQQRGKTNMEIERTAVCTGAPTTNNLVEMASEWRRNRSYVDKTLPMKDKNESQRNFHHTLLLIFTLLATVTFHTALKFYLPRCRLQEGYETNSSLDSNFQTENQSSYSTRILIMLNSVAFFLSAGMMMVLFNELPYRPWLLVLVFSMIGSYICILMNPMNPSLCSS